MLFTLRSLAQDGVPFSRSA